MSVWIYPWQHSYLCLCRYLSLQARQQAFDFPNFFKLFQMVHCNWQPLCRGQVSLPVCLAVQCTGGQPVQNYDSWWPRGSEGCLTEAGAGVSLICKQLWAASLTVIAGQSAVFQHYYTERKMNRTLSCILFRWMWDILLCSIILHLYNKPF